MRAINRKASAILTAIIDQMGGQQHAGSAATPADDESLPVAAQVVTTTPARVYRPLSRVPDWAYRVHSA